MPGLRLADYGWNVREPRDKGNKRRRACPAKRKHEAGRALRSASAKQGRADGPSACPGDSSLERASVSASGAPGACSKPQSPSRAGRRRSSCIRGGYLSRVFFQTLHTRLRVQLSARRSARPLEGKDVRRDRFPVHRTQRAGDDARPSSRPKPSSCGGAIAVRRTASRSLSSGRALRGPVGSPMRRLEG